jgi:uncharacterized SAM-binding protein YcdF (DUF218 family)
MLFTIEKLVELTAQPDNLLVLALAAGVLALAGSGGRRGLGLVVIVTLIFVAFMLLPLGAWALRPLEDRFPLPQPMPAQVDGIVLLGGSLETDLTLARDQVMLNDAAERMTETVALARLYPKARIVVSGAHGDIVPVPLTEAAVMTRLLIEDGVSPDRIIPEDRSRNTFENAVFSKEVAKPKPGDTWLLVTSAWHMPRSVGCFRAVGWKVVPYPVDYRTPRPLIHDVLQMDRNLAQASLAEHEWIGLIGYRLHGWIDAYFPAPSSS